MEAQQLVREIEGLPEATKRQIEDSILTLKLHYSRQTPLTEEEIARWSDPEVFGIYADREDMRDSTAYVKKLREQQWGPK